MTLTNVKVTGGVWINDPADLDESLVENEKAVLMIERTDEDEVAIHATVHGDDQAVVTLYTDRSGAFALAGLLQAAATMESR